MTRDIFTPRETIKPYEYPEFTQYKDAIRHSYWIQSEFNYDPDVQDIRVNLKPHEAQAVFKTMLAISQIENKVKKFWHNMGTHLPKPEIEDIAATFSESEVRHKDAYAHLLEKLGLNREFETLMEVPAIRDRIKYIDKINEKIKASSDPKQYFEAIILFSTLIENISLFSQFYIIMSFDKFNKQLKGMANAVEATSKEEDLHARFGFELIQVIKEEHPEWWNDEVKSRIYDVCKKAVEAEKKVLDWIYFDGNLETAPKETVIEFIKNRMNKSLQEVGLDRIFEVNPVELEKTTWFDIEISTTKDNDFFQKRATTYSKGNKAITAEDLF